MTRNSSEAPTDSVTVPWSDIVRFVRQLSHDLRNDLNAIELQSAYIGELTQNQELTSEIKRLREIVSGMNSTLQLLSRAVGERCTQFRYLSGRRIFGRHAHADRAQFFERKS